MKSHLRYILFAGVSLYALLSLASSVLAQDQTVNGNLSVTGNTDLEGNTLSFGTAGANAGVVLSYADGTPATVSLGATRNTTNWVWMTNTTQEQMQLGADNKLSLFDQSATPVTTIILDPQGSRIGIGTANPQGLLTVQSPIEGAPQIYITKSDSGTFSQNGGAITFENNHQHDISRNAGVISGAINFNYSQPTSGVSQLGASIQGVSDYTQSGGDTPTAIVFSTFNSSYYSGLGVRGVDERMRIASNGNVGIGTTAPMAKLDVAGDMKVQGNLTVTGSNVTLPNQSLSNQYSILTQQLADQKYLAQDTTSISLAGAMASTAPGFSAGSGNLAGGQYSTAIGTTSNAGGDYSVALGNSNETWGTGAIALGTYVGAVGSYSFGAGYECQAYGDSSIAIGYGNQAYGTTSIALGYQCYSYGGSALASGYGAQTSGMAATSLGIQTSANGDFSSAIGEAGIAQGKSQFVIGRYNIPQGSNWNYAETDNVFIVGNGTSGSPSNALTVNWNGDMWIAGNLVAPDGKIGIGVSAPAANLDVAGTTILRGEVTSQAKIRIPASGDLSMGSFTAGTNPAPLP